MSNVINLHQTTAAKSKGVGIIAYLQASRLQLTPTQCAAWARRAREQYSSGGKSAARVVSDVRAQLQAATSGGAA